MPEADQEGKRYYADQPQATPGFFLKGSHQLDWGMKNRLARTFNPQSGRTVMLAVDETNFLLEGDGRFATTKDAAQGLAIMVRNIVMNALQAMSSVPPRSPWITPL